MSGKFALIIANTEYIDSGLAQLAAPGRDAEDFGRVLKDQNIGAFDNVKILLNQLSSTVSESIDEFFDQRKTDDLLVLYFSGHGVRDELGSLYLAVRNTIRSRLRSTAIKSDYIRDVMDQSRSKRQVLILDCCNSGAFAQGSKAATGVSIGTASAFEGTGYGRVVLTASDSTQFAWEGDTIIGKTDNSLFTHFLVKGLEGEADRDGDGRITIDELYDYTYEQIVNITPKQTPGKWSYKQQGEIVLRQNIRIEDTKPVPLPDDLVAAMNNSLPYIREGAVTQLELLLKGKNLSLARSARLALERIVAEDDSRRVVQAATKALESIHQGEQKEAQTAEESQSASPTRTAQLRREKMEQEARFKTEQTKLLQEKAELEKRLKEEQTTREKSEGQQKAKEEDQQVVAQRTEAEHPAPERAKDRPAPPKSRWMPIGIVGAALITIIACGYAMTRLMPLLFGSNPTEASTAAIATTEGEPALTEAPIPITGPTESEPTPTEAPIPTTAPTEDKPTPTEAPIATTAPTEDATIATPYPTEITDGKGVEMVLVEAGNFSMGSGTGDSDEKPVHSVYLDAYYIDKFEVTNALYKDCVDARVCNPPINSGSYTRSSYYGNPQYDKFPVVYVNWNMAKAYCEWRGARLPTEAQWEKAARGTDARVYPWGKAVDCQKANYQGGNNGCAGGTNETGSYESGKSPYGAYDMAGNVWEWVADWYSETYYQTSLPSNPFGPDLGQSRVLRGGSWNRSEYESRASNRLKYGPDYNNFDIGFRCARSLQSETAVVEGEEMVLVEAGNFSMGSGTGDSDEKPVHSVYLDAFYIDKYEVTNALYKACVTARICNPPINSGSYTRNSYYGNSQYDEYPVVYVNWNMAKAYCEWRGARLPTEAQWEKAARGTDARVYPWGKAVDCQKANYQGGKNGCAGGTSRVGSYESGKSPYGVYDMAGNVWEWVADWYSEIYYQSSPLSNPFGPDLGQSRVLRGGSWNRSEYDSRASNRLKYGPDYNNFDIGFRCAREASP